jgi:hypothetical protein
MQTPLQVSLATQMLRLLPRLLATLPRCKQGGSSGARLGLCIGGRGSSAVDVAASEPAVRLGSELALKLHEAPDLGAVHAYVGLDVGGRLVNGGQVDAEQLRAPLQRRCDRPAHVRVGSGPTATA